MLATVEKGNLQNASTQLLKLKERDWMNQCLEKLQNKSVTSRLASQALWEISDVTLYK